ncbi:MAG: ATP-binding cassette domain-containing protein [Desulfovibrio sp.]|uniref:ATP-binding cassette domain-containing protein n=1 Tax=Desulfovibrio sp. TaxID=885 RepID=UPI00135EE6EE|nr:ATP-binding cassette domain-containing protein [Desulfovibrio sp.]MTJ93387.1 ATP-binding cassette domain-containing protein [Desulfovibrio sp.]
MSLKMVNESSELALSCLSLTPGRDKAGQPERAYIHFKPGEITALLGPTGAGKSRFLGDIEALAAGDTPTGRTVLLNGAAPDEDTRFDLQGRLVAQLTQNMNFVLDMGVMDFLRTHALSREVADAEGAARRVFEAANELAGEPFQACTQLTQLSGGQSRALMIADTALLSWSPVLLIDEIENAGVDKRKALNLLLASDKIIVMATHDPVLALAADRRLVFEQGAVAAVLARSPAEDALLARLEDMERQWSGVREALRKGTDMSSWADC